MNLLFVCDEYTPDLTGGIATVVKIVAETLVKRGHKVFVVGTYWDDKSNLQKEESINGVSIIHWKKSDFLGIGLLLVTLLYSLCSLLGLKRLYKRLVCVKKKAVFKRKIQLINTIVRKEHIDLIEMPDYYDDFHYYPFRVPKNRFLVPMIIRVHGSVSFLYNYNKGYMPPTVLAADRSLFAKADGVSAVSKFSKSFVCEHLCAKGKEVDVIYNPIEDWLFDNVKDIGNPHNILFIGKITEGKGAYSILKAFNEVSKKHSEVHLRLVGEGLMQPALDLIEDHCVGRVHILGFLHREKVMEEIDNSSFCVLPSFFENFSMAALEVQARKRALVYTNRASGSELIEDGVNGLLVDPANVEQLVEKMNSLIEDDALRDRLAVKGYETCRGRFSAQVIVPEIEKYYESMIQKCRK